MFMYWKLSPELQKLFEEIVAETARLNAALGFKSLTLEERAEAYYRKQEEQAKVAAKTVRKPLPKL